MQTPSHPSFLQLDRMSLDAGNEETQTHVAGCAECQAYLGRLQLPAPVPAWVREPASSRGWLPGWFWNAAGSLAALVFLLVGARVLIPDTGTRPMGGGPTVFVHVKHGQAVTGWDFKRPVEVGDLLRLEIVHHGLTHVRVSSPGGGGPEVLFEGDLGPEPAGLLPVSWRVDEAPGDEILDVTLSAPGQTPWQKRLVLRKTRP